MKKKYTPEQKERRRFNSEVWLFNDEARRFFADQPRLTGPLPKLPEARRDGGGITPPYPPPLLGGEDG